jgi:hypothetical protein
MATPTNLPTSFTDGTSLPASSLNNLRGAFRILQVVSFNTNSQVTAASTTEVNTGLTATITPQSSSSKILVCVQQNGLLKITNDTSMALILYRGATEIAVLGAQIAVTGSAATNGVGGAGIDYLDSPATTSAVTYKTTFLSVNNSATVAVQHAGARSSIVLMEVSA